MNQLDFDVGPGAATQLDWPPSRREGLTRIEAFVPRMGAAYAARRNYDLGPDERRNVSLLSPYIRRRMVTEAEVLGAALAAHPHGTVEKFVQEVFWRSYWKGWLESRPTIWTAYRIGLEADLARLDAAPALRRAVAEAEAGTTGIACFDSWMQELAATGYLHNHARMWFASIWIFTLGLPWRLGADVFLRHLIDGDPASNTLSWRWVAGLHTRGKHYTAIASNIATFTEGRFTPGARTLNEAALPLPDDGPPVLPTPLRSADRPDPVRPTALLITEEDCCPETLGLPLDRMRATATLQITAARSPRPVSDIVATFDRGALEDAAMRAETSGAPVPERLAGIGPADLVAWAQRSGAAQIVTAWAPAGPVREFLDAARAPLRAEGITLAMVRRPYDDIVWPHATAGFFKLKEKIPRLIERLRVA